jgi:hypothetical protein
MPVRLTKPTEVRDDHQPLVDMLWRFYVAANAPSMRKIAQVIASQDDRAGTANHETVRRTLRADQVPEWQTVEVIFLALCQIADVDPDDEDDLSDYDQYDEERGTHRDALRKRYRLAKYGVVEHLPRTREMKARQENAKRAERSSPLHDPWGSGPPF